MIVGILIVALAAGLLCLGLAVLRLSAEVGRLRGLAEVQWQINQGQAEFNDLLVAAVEAASAKRKDVE